MERWECRCPGDKSVRVCPCVCLGVYGACGCISVCACACACGCLCPHSAHSAHDGVRRRGHGLWYCIRNASANSNNRQLHFSLETSAKLANDSAVALFQSLTLHMHNEPPPVKFSGWQKTAQLSMTRELAWWLVRSFLQLSNCHISQHYSNQEMSRQLHLSGIQNSEMVVLLFCFRHLLLRCFRTQWFNFRDATLVMVAIPAAFTQTKPQIIL